MAKSGMRFNGVWKAVAAVAALVLGTTGALRAADDSPSSSRPEMPGLRKFQFLVGQWRASSQGGGVKRTGNVEAVRWQWHFAKDEPAALKMIVDDGLYFKGGMLKFDPERDKYTFVAQKYKEDAEDPKKAETETVIFEGKYAPSEEDPNVLVLSLSRRIPGGAGQERIALRLQEGHHYVFQLDKRNTAKLPFRPARIFSVTREGESIAALDEAKEGPVCIVSGGLGTSTMTYKGQVYHFCCSGCLESFKEDPEKYIAEAKKAAAKK